MSILIKNGTVVNATKTIVADIFIKDGKIAGMGSGISIDNNTVVIDAVGKYVFPGGIDPHVHMHLPTPAGYSSDDFYTGSLAALAGGTTTIIDFVTPRKGEPLCRALEKRKEEAADCLTDYSFHVSPIEWRDDIGGEILMCIKSHGITSFKVYMAYKESIGLDDDDLKRVMKAVSGAGGTVTVHCEEGDKIEELRNGFYNSGKRTPQYHPLSRPPELEAQAVKKAIAFANETNCKLYIVHVSSKFSLEYIKKAQERGQKVFAETCPHYLLLDESKYKGQFNKTAPFVLSPPLRKKEDNNALWEALDGGILQTAGTDHCPFNMNQKLLGIDDFRKIANGAGGVEHRLTLLYTYGVLNKRISLNKFVEITSTNAAKIFGLYPRKGIIATGSDADLIVWNPKTENIISAKNHIMNCDNDIFEGFKTKGMAETVIRRGEIVAKNGKPLKNISKGDFLFRNK